MCDFDKSPDLRPEAAEEPDYAAIMDAAYTSGGLYKKFTPETIALSYVDIGAIGAEVTPDNAGQASGGLAVRSAFDAGRALYEPDFLETA